MPTTLAHIPAVQHLAGMELVAVASGSQARADAAAKVFGAKSGYADGKDLIQDPGVDIMAVAVKVPDHRELVLAALAAGKYVTANGRSDEISRRQRRPHRQRRHPSLSPKNLLVQLKTLHFDLAAEIIPPYLLALKQLLSTSHLLTDFDFHSCPCGRSHMQSMQCRDYDEFSKGDKEDIFSKNALSLYPRLASKANTANTKHISWRGLMRRSPRWRMADHPSDAD